VIFFHYRYLRFQKSRALQRQKETILINHVLDPTGGAGSPKKQGRRYRLLYLEAKEMMHVFPEVKIHQVKREHNKVSHELAQLGRRETFIVQLGLDNNTLHALSS
jgi:hypothetical protein